MPLAHGDIYIPVGFLRNLLATIEQLGFDSQPFLQQHDINAQQLSFSTAKLPFPTYVKVCLDILEQTEVPVLGIESAERIGLPEHGQLGYLIAASKNLEQTLDAYKIYAPLVGNHIVSRLARVGEFCTMTVDTSVLDPWPPLMRMEVEQELAVWFNMKRNWLMPFDWFEEVHFSFSAEGNEDIYQRYFSCPVHFNAGGNYFVFKAQHLQTPFTGANEDIFRLTLEQCKVALAEMSSRSGVAAEIRQMLSLCVNSFPSFEQVAKELHMSPATLRRRLGKEGTNYKVLLKQTRMEMASRYLLETELSVSEIAFMTGYAEPASFNHAFREAKGMAPTAFRER